MRRVCGWKRINEKRTWIKSGTIYCLNNAEGERAGKCIKGVVIMSIKVRSRTTIDQPSLSINVREGERNSLAAKNNQGNQGIVQKIRRRSIDGNIDSQGKVRLACCHSWTKEWRYPINSRKILSVRIGQGKIGRKNKKIGNRVG